RLMRPYRWTTVAAAASLALAILLASQAIGGANPAPQDSTRTTPSGDIVLTVAETTEADAFVRTLPFPVKTVSVFLMEQQRFVTYVHGGPAYVNRLFTGAMDQDSVVWLRLPPGSRD